MECYKFRDMIFSQNIHSINGGKPVKVRPSLDRGFIAVTARFLKYSEMKLKEFKPNSKEVEYWRRVHQLNATEERRIKERQSQLLPARNYIIHTLENLTPGGE